MDRGGRDGTVSKNPAQAELGRGTRGSLVLGRGSAQSKRGPSAGLRAGSAPLPRVLQQSFSYLHQVAGVRFDHDPDAFAGTKLECVARRQRYVDFEFRAGAIHHG